MEMYAKTFVSSGNPLESLSQTATRRAQ